MNGFREIGVFPRKLFRNFSTYYVCAVFNWFLLVTKKKLRSAGFFASLPFLTYLCKIRQTNTINILCSIMKKKIVQITRAVSNKHLLTGPKGNSEFRFPEIHNVPRGEAEGNIESPSHGISECFIHNTLLNLQNSSYPTKRHSASFNNCQLLQYY